MSLRVNNSCRKAHKLNVEKIIRHILRKIPESVLDGLDEIHIFDSKEEKHPDIKYIPKSSKSKYSVISINMDHPALSGMPLFSILTLNVMFIFAIHDHIKKSWGVASKDKEMLPYSPGRINYDWMYLGVWNPLLILFKIINYLISKIGILGQLASSIANRMSKNT